MSNLGLKAKKEIEMLNSDINVSKTKYQTMKKMKKILRRNRRKKQQD